MKIQYLGTAASEGWPALFCRCEACEKARKLGGRDIRTRSQSLVDDRLIIDMPPDTFYHALKFSVDLPSIQDILITHTHEDHFYPLDLILKAPPYAHGGSVQNLHVYGSAAVTGMLKETMKLSGIPEIEDYITPVEVEAYKPFKAGDHTVTALPADYMKNENCYIYIVENDGKRLLYAHDTGIFPRETWVYIRGMRFDAVSLDCTFVLDYNERGHMGFPNALEVKRRFLHDGCADGNTRFVINHFSHNGNKTHAEISAHAAGNGFLTAYDGMSLMF